jgi:hypothetical protein
MKMIQVLILAMNGIANHHKIIILFTSPAIGIPLHEDEFNDTRSIYSADISLEDNDNLHEDEFSSQSQESNNDFQSDLEQSLSDMSINSINKDVIDDSNKPGKFLIYLLYYNLYKTNIFCFII